MNKQDYLLKLHEEIMVIMDEIDRICTENNLQYYMIGGTLLGAVRHKGFIPWDDDFDICMPRKDFNKFISIVTTEMNKDFELKWVTTDKQYWLLFAKVCRKNTLFDQKEYSEAKKSFGIFVDVFPLDESKGYRKSLDWRKNILKKISNMCGAKKDPSKMKWYKVIISRLFTNRFLYRINEFISTLDSGKETNYYTSFGSQRAVNRQTILKEYYGNGVLLPFENRYYKAPVNYDGILLSLFGENYMEIPPIDKQVTHNPKKICFSDGHIEYFDDDL